MDETYGDEMAGWDSCLMSWSRLGKGEVPSPAPLSDSNNLFFLVRGKVLGRMTSGSGLNISSTSIGEMPIPLAPPPSIINSLSMSLTTAVAAVTFDPTGGASLIFDTRLRLTKGL
jgi:hypothetical protein